VVNAANPRQAIEPIDEGVTPRIRFGYIQHVSVHVMWPFRCIVRQRKASP
jgi:hypothetical protein